MMTNEGKIIAFILCVISLGAGTFFGTLMQGGCP